MSRRELFDLGHKMNHHRLLRGAGMAAAGAVFGSALIGGSVGAAAGAGLFLGLNNGARRRNTDNQEHEDEEEEW
mgnify:CR=1 FL=1